LGTSVGGKETQRLINHFQVMPNSLNYKKEGEEKVTLQFEKEN
jgi:hypothetical protein